MPIVCGLDFETNGLDPKTCYPIEIAWVIAEYGGRTLTASSSLLHDKAWGENYVSEDIARLCGVTNLMLKRYGTCDPTEAIREMVDMCQALGVEYIIAHNGTVYDRVIFERYSSYPFRWIDSRTDVPWPESIKTRKLTYLACEHGFNNPFPHNALSDVLTMLNLVGRYSFDIVVDRSSSPMTIVRAMVSYQDRDQAKAAGYSWEKWNDLLYPKCWVKQIKQCDLHIENNRGFRVEILD